MKKYFISFLLCFLLVGVFSLSASAHYISQEFTFKDEFYIPEEAGNYDFFDFYFTFDCPQFPDVFFDTIRIYPGDDVNPVEVYYKGYYYSSLESVEYCVYLSGWEYSGVEVRTIQPLGFTEVYDVEASILINSIDGYDEVDHTCDGSLCDTSDLYGIESVCPNCGKPLVKSVAPDVPDLPDYPVDIYPSDFPPLTNVNYPFNEFFAFRGSDGSKYLIQLQGNQSPENVAVRGRYYRNVPSFEDGLRIEIQTSNNNIVCTLFKEYDGVWRGNTITTSTYSDGVLQFLIDIPEEITPEYSTFNIYNAKDNTLFFLVAPPTLLELVNSKVVAVVPAEIVGACWILVPLAIGLMVSLILLNLFRKKLLMV